MTLEIILYINLYIYKLKHVFIYINEIIHLVNLAYYKHLFIKCNNIL